MGCLPKDCGSLTVSRPLFQAGDARKLKSWPEKGDLLEFESGNGTFSKLGGTWETCTNPLETQKCVCVFERPHNAPNWKLQWMEEKQDGPQQEMTEE